jgi:hypothetical protein
VGRLTVGVVHLDERLSTTVASTVHRFARLDAIVGAARTPPAGHAVHQPAHHLPPEVLVRLVLERIDACICHCHESCSVRRDRLAAPELLPREHRACGRARRCR